MRKSNRSEWKKIAVMLVWGIVLSVTFTACRNGGTTDEVLTDIGTNEINLACSAEEAAVTPVMTIGAETIYLDEIRYYCYNTQATYEAVYATDGKGDNLDWNSEMSEGVTMEEAVKSTILNRICEREAMVSYAEEYRVALTEEELSQISEKTDIFFEQSNPKLLGKIDIRQERLKELFEKDALCQKVKEEMENENEGTSDEVYKNWKKVNTVTTNEYWEKMNFQTPILMESNQ